MRAGSAGAAAARAALLGAALHLVAGTAAAQQPPAPFPVMGVDRLTEGTVVEYHAEVLSRWVERGFKGAVLLHLDPDAGLRDVPEERIAALSALRDRGDLDALARSGRGGADALFDEGTFVRAAAALGIVREMIWVVPFTFLGEVDADDRLRGFLGSAGFSAADIGSFRRDGGCYRGAVGALPVALCTHEKLPPVGEPVLLSLDADYLPLAAGQRGNALLSQIKALAAALREGRYAVRDAVVAHSVMDGAVPVELRWAAEAIVGILRDPSLLSKEEPPERWGALQRLSTLWAAGPQGGDEMLNVALSLLDRQPHDAALLLFAAEAMASHGGGDSALSYAGQACRADPGYCPGLREIGLQLLERGAVEEAARFFATAEQMLPGMRYRRLDEGILLAKAGRLPEAVAVFETSMERDGPFPGAFLVGAVHEAAGDRAAARRAYDAGLAALARPHLSVARTEVATAIRGAAGFYREQGLVAEAERLEGDARLRLPARGGGR